AVERQCDGRRGSPQRPEHNEVRGEDEEQAPDHRTLAQPRGLPAKLEEAAPARAEALDNPAGQPEQPQFFGGRRVDGEAVGIIGAWPCSTNPAPVSVSRD